MLGSECKSYPSTIKELFPWVNEHLIDILDKMLQFNPYFRPTTKELLKHPIFNSIRTDIEIRSEHKVVVDLDENEHAQNYDKNKTSHEKKAAELEVIKMSLVTDFIKLNNITKSSYKIRFQTETEGPASENENTE